MNPALTEGASLIKEPRGRALVAATSGSITASLWGVARLEGPSLGAWCFLALKDGDHAVHFPSFLFVVCCRHRCSLKATRHRAPSLQGRGVVTEVDTGKPP